ncbi:MAG TPA: VRR-NUC domain-containing protein [Polyangia bacterium]|nr:VRR-NUC domain-containing protein [Polyangia bacterium]
MGHRVRLSPLGELVQPESVLLSQVMAYAHMRGWRTSHDRATNAPRRCRDCGSYQRIPRNTPGLPDLILLRRPRLVIAELKREGEKPTSAQQRWLDEFAACGIETFVWFPHDFETIKAVLL